jgi:hypothetical protein
MSASTATVRQLAALTPHPPPTPPWDPTPTPRAPPNHDATWQVRELAALNAAIANGVGLAPTEEGDESSWGFTRQDLREGDDYTEVPGSPHAQHVARLANKRGSTVTAGGASARRRSTAIPEFDGGWVPAELSGAPRAAAPAEPARPPPSLSSALSLPGSKVSMNKAVKGGAANVGTEAAPTPHPPHAPRTARFSRASVV